MPLVPQFSFIELILIAIVILVVVGPKDLPRLMRTAGQYAAKARRMAGEFTAAFDQMARETEMEELRKEIDDLKNNNPIADVKRAVKDTIAPIDKEFREQADSINKAVMEPTPEDEPKKS